MVPGHVGISLKLRRQAEGTSDSKQVTEQGKDDRPRGSRKQVQGERGKDGKMSVKICTKDVNLDNWWWFWHFYVTWGGCTWLTKNYTPAQSAVLVNGFEALHE